MREDLDVERLLSLIVSRNAALNVDDAWDGYGLKQSEEALSRLEKIQNDILTIQLKVPRAWVLATQILVDGDDQPNFADDFKNKLFDALRAFR